MNDVVDTTSGGRIGRGVRITQEIAAWRIWRSSRRSLPIVVNCAYRSEYLPCACLELQSKSSVRKRLEVIRGTGHGSCESALGRAPVNVERWISDV